MKVFRIAAVLCLASALAFGQAADPTKVFTVKVGPSHQTSQIGLVMGNLQPTIGLDYLSAGFNVDILSETSAESPVTMKMVKLTEMGITVKGNASIWMPHAGVKYTFRSGESRPYVFANAYKAFTSVDAEMEISSKLYDEEGRIEDSVSDKQDLLDKKQKQFVEDLLGHWGLTFGFGVEWRVNKHFGIAGEYGIQLHFLSAKQDKVDLSALSGLLGGDPEVLARQGEEPVTETSLDLSAGLRKSQAAVSLNFYF